MARAGRARRAPEQPPSASDEKQVRKEHARRRQSLGATISNARTDGYLSDVELGRPAVTSDLLVRLPIILACRSRAFWQIKAPFRTED